jgi:LuxR family transcriptional regulator, maltose regulon positive regulatory protein
MTGVSVGSERDVLLATKLHVPGTRPGFVPRPRLADRLEEGLDRKLVLVSAPAGSGKTALLADWARRNRRPVAWLSLDPAENDPARFWRHAAVALDQVRPGIAGRVAELLGPPVPRSFRGVVTAVINDIAAQPAGEDILLFLDDYNLIGSQRVHESLAFLIEHLPPGLHLVLASRADPPLGLARLRAGAQLAEVRADDLRFTLGEAAALLRQAAGADLPDTAIAALTSRTEGWAAGLQLAGLSLRGRPDIPAFVAAFDGSHRYVLDYLTGEVLDRQSGETRAFLLETSVLDRMSGPLCDAVTGRSDGQAMLEAIERANLFLVPLDEVRGWWRYHHLFADLLRGRLEREHPGRAGQLRRAAFAAEPFEPSAGTAASFLVNVPARIALDRAYLADLRGDGESTATFATKALAEIREGETMLRSHAVATLAMADWLRGRLPEAERGFASSVTAWREAGRPALALAAWGYRSLGQVQRAQGHLGAALQTYRQAAAITAAARQAAAPTAGTGNVGLAEIAYARGDLDTALRHVSESITRNRELVYTPLLSIGLALLAWIKQAQGDPAGALDSMMEAARLAPDPAITSLLNPVPAERARLLLAQGDVAAADRWVAERGLSADDELAYPREVEYLVLARVLIARGLPGRALALLERMHAAAASQGRVGCIIETRALQALALAASGEEGRAVGALAEALALGHPEGYVRVFADEGPPMRALLDRLAPAQRARRDAAHGVPAGYLARIRRALDSRSPGRVAAVGAAPGLPDPLTPREREVLGLLAQGRANRDIAAELVVTLDTVKRHVSHILAKLGAANRTEAVARARDLNLIP